jgi:hypothetical protein
MVMTWLVNSMEEEINSNYLCYSTAKELRKSLKEMYSDLENKSQIYELTLKVREIQQEVIMSQNTSIPRSGFGRTLISSVLTSGSQLRMPNTIDKHVEVDKHFIKEKIERGQICITYIPTTEQLADIFTK